MGYYTTYLGSTMASYHASELDYIKRRKPLDYYKNYKITITIEKGKDSYEELAALEELFDIVKLKVNYDWEWKEEKTLHKWLYNYLKSNGEKIEGYIHIDWRYFLNSELGDSSVTLTNCKRLYEIKDYREFELIHYMGLSFSSKEKE